MPTPEDPPIYTKTPAELGFLDHVPKPPSTPDKPRKKAKKKANGAMEARASMAGQESIAASPNFDARPDIDACDRAMSDLFKTLREWRRVSTFGGSATYERPLAQALDRYEASLRAVVDEDERLAAAIETSGDGSA